MQRLQDQVISLGGQLDHVGPVEPSVDMILEHSGGGATSNKGARRKRLGSAKSNRSSKSATPATTNGGQSLDAMEISTLLNENEMLKKKLTSLEAHMSSGGSSDNNIKKHAQVLRQPSVLFALSSVHNVDNGSAEDDGLVKHVT